MIMFFIELDPETRTSQKTFPFHRQSQKFSSDEKDKEYHIKKILLSFVAGK